MKRPVSRYKDKSQFYKFEACVFGVEKKGERIRVDLQVHGLTSVCFVWKLRRNKRERRRKKKEYNLIMRGGGGGGGQG